MAASDLLLEVGTEEIPAGFLAKAIGDLASLAAERFRAARLEFASVVTLGTPRRLALAVGGLADRQPDISEVVTGPPAKVAFDSAGKPTRACLGFAQKLGVPIEAVTVMEVPGKGAYAVANRSERGAQARELLPALLSDLVRSIPWKKAMRWASLNEPFVRPVHWIVALYAGEVVPLEMYGVQSGRMTRGHRFLAPDPISLDGSLDGYQRSLREAFVIVDPASRRTMIEAEIARLEEQATDDHERLRVRPDEALLAEVTNLVEYPRAVVGSFDRAHLALPDEVIVSAMRSHQRYFAAERPDGTLANRFVTIAGTITRDLTVVRRGNERVLAARLADARFFFDEDRETPLGDMVAKLAGIVFQAKLGSVGEKVERTRRSRLPALTGVDPAKFDRAVVLAKADLVSKMVGEFPDLQGVMGRHYATLAGEDPEVADAILEHYLPRGASDRLPTGALGAAVGIADRVDTIVGCFAAGLQPTGSADAFGLRRAALAVLNVLLDRGWGASLADLVASAQAELAQKISPPPGLAEQVLEFLRGRLRGLFVEGRRLPADCVDAALAAGFLVVPDALARSLAVARLRERADFEPLGIAFKRVANILKGEAPRGEPDPARFVHPSERELWERFLGVRRVVEGHVASAEYDGALSGLAALKPDVDRFFDDVLVMDKDAKVKDNRLALLGTINAAFNKIADFRQLAV